MRKRTYRIYCGLLIFGLVALLASQYQVPLTLSENAPTALPEEIFSLIKRADTIELLSLDGFTRDKDLDKFDEREMSASKFHGQTIYGSLKLTDDPTMKQVRAAIISSVPAVVNTPAAACFWPRHGLRFTAGSEQIDLVICFQCSNLCLYQESEKYWFHVTSSGKRTLNRLLTDAKIRIEPE